jgi:hypothetical protein
MRQSLTFEMQRRAPDDHIVIEDTLVQCVLTNEMGVDALWFVEHVSNGRKTSSHPLGSPCLHRRARKSPLPVAPTESGGWDGHAPRHRTQSGSWAMNAGIAVQM